MKLRCPYKIFFICYAHVQVWFMMFVLSVYISYATNIKKSYTGLLKNAMINAVMFANAKCILRTILLYHKISDQGVGWKFSRKVIISIRIAPWFIKKKERKKISWNMASDLRWYWWWLVKWDKVLKNGPSEICERQSSKNLKIYGVL